MPLITRTLSRPYRRQAMCCLPLSLQGEVLNLAVANPFDHDLFEQVSRQTGRKIRPYLTAKQDILHSISGHLRLQEHGGARRGRGGERPGRLQLRAAGRALGRQGAAGRGQAGHQRLRVPAALRLRPARQRHPPRAQARPHRHAAAHRRRAPPGLHAAPRGARAHRRPLQDALAHGHQREAQARRTAASRRRRTRPRSSCASARCPPRSARRWCCASSTPTR